MTGSKIGLRITAIDAFRAALAIRNVDERNPTLHAAFTNSNATELFTTDGFGVAFVPLTEPLASSSIDWATNPAIDTIRIQTLNTRVPARARNITILVDTTVTEAIINIDEQPAGVAFVTLGSAPRARQVVPADLPPLAIAPPYAFDAIRAANVLRASKTPPQNSETVQLPGGGIAFRWRFDTGGEYVQVSNRGDDHAKKRFEVVLSVCREKAPF